MTERDDGFLRIDDRNFFGEYSTSPNGKYTIAWSGHDGLYFLLRGDEVIAEGSSLERPNGGRVSDTGTFVINDWTNGSAVTGVFYAMNQSGAVIVRQRTRANLGLAWISPDGRYAAFHTLRAPNNRDDSKIFFFDLSSCSLQWKHEVPVEWPESFSIDTREGVFSVHCLGRRAYRFSIDGGEFLGKAERDADELDGLTRGYGYPLLDRAYALLDKVEREDGEAADYAEIENLLRRAVGMSISDYTAARAYRALGEIAQKTARLNDAVTFYARALDFDSSVGVKRRLAQLSKETGIDPAPDVRSRTENETASKEPDGPYRVVDGRRALNIVGKWKTKHAVGALGLTASGDVLWAPARNPCVACQNSDGVRWTAELDGHPRVITGAGRFIYVVTGQHGKDKGTLFVLDEQGRDLGSFALPGFASTISVNPASGRALVASCGRDIKQASLLVFDGRALVSQCNITPTYHWMEVGLLSTGQWVVNCHDALLLLESDGTHAATLTPPPEIKPVRDVAYRISLSIDEEGNLLMEGDSGFRVGGAVKAYELLGLRPPTEPSEIKAAFRQKLLEWHPDRNPAPNATAMTRELINAYNTALENPDVRAKQPERGERAERHYESPDTIRSLVIDEHTGEAFLGCSSGLVYRLDGDMLRLHWNSESCRDLLYSRTGGSSMLVRDEDVISVLPAGSSVARSDAIASAFSLRVRGSSALGHLIIYSGDAREIFIGTSAFARYDHLRFPRPVRDVVIDEAGKRVYIAAGDIYAAEFNDTGLSPADGSMPPPGEALPAPQNGPK